MLSNELCIQRNIIKYSIFLDKYKNLVLLHKRGNYNFNRILGISQTYN